MSYIHPENEDFVADEVRYLTVLVVPVAAHLVAPPSTHELGEAR